MRAFPKIKPIEYDPDAMAKRLARARELGNLPNLDGEEGEEEFLRHRRQRHSFDLRKEREQVKSGEEEPSSRPVREVKEPKKVRRQRQKKAPKPLSDAKSYERPVRRRKPDPVPKQTEKKETERAEFMQLE